MSPGRPFRRLLYGGTFDPVHVGHIAVAEAAGRLLGADRVSLIPAADPPHKDAGPFASAADRLAMARLAVEGHPLLDVLDVEVRRGGRSYTIDTVRELLAGPCRGESLLLLVGDDALAILPTWHRIHELLRLVPFVVAPRRGGPEPDWAGLAAALGSEPVAAMRARRLDTPRRDVSSTDIRQRIADGRSIRCRVPDPVADHIAAHGLYRAASRARPKADRDAFFR